MSATTLPIKDLKRVKEMVEKEGVTAQEILDAKHFGLETEAREWAEKQIAPPAATIAEEPESPFLAPTDTLGYLRRLFEPGDYVDIKVIHEIKKFTDKSGVTRAETRDYFQTLEQALEPSTPGQIIQLQDEGWHVYVCMNPLMAGSQHRRKKDIAAVRTVYVEFDENGEVGLDKIDEDVKAGIVPDPDFILESSPGKFYVVWRVTGFDVRQQEALNRALQQRYGSDPQSVDVTRVLRLPGTRNLKAKYSPTPVVEIIHEVVSDRYTPEDFKVERDVPAKVNREGAPEKVQMRMAFYEEACDNAGVDAGTLTAKDDGSYNYVVACPNFEEHTTGGEFDASVWISPSGAISFGCFHSHCAGKDWKTFYRPWLEEQAVQNGYKGKLKFGEASEVDDTAQGSLLLNQQSVNQVADRTVSENAGPSRPMTDLGNAERLADAHGENLRYCDDTGKWFMWDSVKWIQSGKSGPQTFAHEMVRDIYEEAAALEPGEPQRKLFAWAKRSEGNNAIAGAISLARGLRGIRVSMTKFDADRYLFNLQNGTYNLKTHQFRAHDKQDLITKVSPVAYNPTTTCPMWDAFLAKSVPDTGTRRFLQQAVGYSLTGDTSEDCLFLSIGNGRNGKGVFLNTLKYLMGDYAIQANFDSFTARKGGGGLEVRTDIARMAGARFVTASENDQDSRLAEGLLKTLTGSDTITARKLYQEEEEYLPQFKLWFAVNNEPRIIGVDDGIWSRIHLILWSVFIKPEERILNLRERLCSEEAAGIFNWAIAGLKDYQKNRLTPSGEVMKASKSFRKNSDQIQRFLDEKCELGDFQVGSSDLYAAYKRWADETKEFQVKDRQFKHYMETRGFQLKHTERGNVWVGVKVKSVSVQGGNNVHF